MGETIFYIVITFIVIIVGIRIYKKLRKKQMLKKDYNRNISEGDVKLRKDLEVLRTQLFNSEDPGVSNELLNKIDALVKPRNKDKK